MTFYVLLAHVTKPGLSLSAIKGFFFFSCKETCLFEPRGVIFITNWEAFTIMSTMSIHDEYSLYGKLFHFCFKFSTSFKLHKFHATTTYDDVINEEVIFYRMPSHFLALQSKPE